LFTAKTFSAERISLSCAANLKMAERRFTMNTETQEADKRRQRTSYTDENYVIVEHLLREDRRVKVREIAEVTDIAKSTVQEIISDLRMRKVSAGRVPKMLTEEHKSKRMPASLENICLYQDE
jgi:hypothetical protein